MPRFSPETFGVPDPQQVPFCGRTDRGIVQNLFRLHDVEDSGDNWELLRREYLERLCRYLPLCPGEVLPGVTQLLGRLGQSPGVALGLLTGNTREGARLKLEHYRLMRHFSFGGYGDEHAERDAVAREALDACRTYFNGDAGTGPIWVVGDTPLDICCARAIGARAVAVATGWHSRQSLEDAEPDLLLSDLRETEAFLAQTLLETA